MSRYSMHNERRGREEGGEQGGLRTEKAGLGQRDGPGFKYLFNWGPRPGTSAGKDWISQLASAYEWLGGEQGKVHCPVRSDCKRALGSLGSLGRNRRNVI